MDDSEILLSYLYVNSPPGVTRAKIDGAFADYEIARERGSALTFGEILVRKGILKKGEPEKILAAERRAHERSAVKDEKKGPVPSTKKPVPAATKKKADKKGELIALVKLVLPALVVGGIVAFFGWRALQPKPPAPVAKKQHAPTRPFVLDDPYAPRSKEDTPPVPDTTLDLRRQLIAEAMSGDPALAEKKLDEAIQNAKSDEERKHLEELRWELHVVKKEREKAGAAIEEARKRALSGDREGAAKILERAEPPPGTPEHEAIAKAKEGEGELGLKLKRESTRKPDETPPIAPRGEWKPETKKKDLPQARTEPEEPEMPSPIPPSEGEEEGAPIPAGELALAEKPKSGRKRNGQRPRGEERGRDLVHSFVDEVDENPGDDAPPVRPEDVKKTVPVEIPAVKPLELEPIRAAAVGAVASAGAEYLARVRDWLTDQQTYRDGAVAREAQRVRDATSETARFLRRIEVPGGLTLTDAVVCEYNAAGFALKDAHAKWGSSWRQNVDIGLDVRKLAVDPNEPRDFMRLGRWLAKNRFFPQARAAFGKARALDSSVARRIPDLDQLEKVSKTFVGSVLRQSDALRVTWDFNSSDELDDFAPHGVVSIGHGRLLLDAREADAARVQGTTPVVCAGRVSLDARVDGEPGVLVLGLLASATDSEAALVRQIVVRFDIQTGRVIVAVGPSIVAVGQAGTSARIVHLELSRDAIEARVGTFYARVPFILPPTFEALPVVGSATGTVSVDQLVLAARADREWLDRVFGDTEFRVALLLEENIGAPPFAYGRPVPQLSAEIAYTATDVTPKILEVYEKARAGCSNPKSPSIVSVGEMRWITEEAPDFAPAQYWVARYALAIDRPAFALGCLNQAVTSAGAFAEALSLRARVLSRLRRFDEAEADVEKALEWRADLACVHEDAAAVAFDQQQLERARAELELAFALEPQRPSSIQQDLAWVSHVLDGPPWEKPARIETEHYVWTSSLKAEKVQQFANALEDTRPYYLAMLGVQPRDEKRKSFVLLFDSRESFIDFNAVARHYRADNAAGFFVLLTKELELFQQNSDPTGEGTSSTLFHEGFHQFFDRIIDGKRIPYWCNEGLGDYFGTTGVLRVYGKPGRKHRGRLRDLFHFGAMPIDDLMNDDGPDFMAHAYQRYAQSWTVVHYIMEGDEKRWKPLLVAYLEQLRAGRSPVNAYNRTFGRIDMDEFERGWKKHVERLRDQVR